MRKTHVPIRHSFACTNIEKPETLADQYQIQFSSHLDVFDPEIIDKFDKILDIFNKRAAVKQIPSITPAEVINMIKKTFSTEKPQDSDGVNNTVLKNLPMSYANLISALTNAIFKCHYFPESWKKAIIPIEKPNSYPVLAKNCHPIRLLPTLPKLTEHIPFHRAAPV